MRKRLREESGGVTVLVAVVVAGFLLIGSIALVVDSGVVYLERRAVANAAQSSTLALARDCVEDPTKCVPSDLLQQLANANSPDGITEITEICIKGKRHDQGACIPPTGRSIDCSIVPGGISSFVRIRTQSRSETNGVGVETFFSRNRSETLRACSQARWGNAASAAVYAPFAVSICEWARNQSLASILKEFDTNEKVLTCKTPFKDMNGTDFPDLPGISGWTALDLKSQSIPEAARASVECPHPMTDKPAELRIGYELSQITKSQSSQDYCGNGDLTSKMSNWLGRTLFIPLVSTPKLSGQATVHKVEAFAGYKLLGYALLKGKGAGSSIGGTVPQGDWCPKNTSCIYGQFIRTISPGSEINDDPNDPQVGLQAIRLF